MTDKEIYEELWNEFYERDRIEWLKEYIKEVKNDMKWTYTDRIIFNKEHLELLLKGLNKL